MKSILGILCCLLCIKTAIPTKSYPVTTLLNAKWHTTPVCLEIAEFLYDESPNLYWDYVNELNTLPVPLYELGKFNSSTRQIRAKKIKILILLRR